LTRTALSKYDPNDLFAPNPLLVRRALIGLLKTPQNNFRVAVNGKSVYNGNKCSESDREELNKMMEGFFLKELGSSKLIHEKEIEKEEIEIEEEKENENEKENKNGDMNQKKDGNGNGDNKKVSEEEDEGGGERGEGEGQEVGGEEEERGEKGGGRIGGGGEGERGRGIKKGREEKEERGKVIVTGRVGGQQP
jgi:Inositol-pentakisphosphate 2-kinase